MFKNSTMEAYQYQRVIALLILLILGTILDDFRYMFLMCVLSLLLVFVTDLIASRNDNVQEKIVYRYQNEVKVVTKQQLNFVVYHYGYNEIELTDSSTSNSEEQCYICMNNRNRAVSIS